MSENNNIVVEDLSEILRIRREKLAELKEMGKDPFCKVNYDYDTYSKDILEGFEELEGKEVSVAGRLISKRGMGKASFCDVMDKEGKIQLYVRQDAIGEESYSMFRKYDIGDIVGVKGEVFRTSKGEISIKAHEVELLAKSLLPLPEKYHGLKDPDLRYRQRYVDLIVNAEVKDTFVKRSKIISAIRNILDNKDFLEVETPLLNAISGGATARPFTTHHNTLDMPLFLRIAPELYLKRLIVGGMGKVYEIGRMFRNEGMSIKHNPEFTMMELYDAFNDYRGMMDITEEIFSKVALEVLGTDKIEYQGAEIDLSPGWERITMIDAIKKYSGIDFNELNSDDEIKTALEGKGIKLDSKITRGEALNLAFEEFVEENLIQPTFVCDYPTEISPLAKAKEDDPTITERFELFINGWEFANAYSELNDPIEQKKRFSDQVAKREAGDQEASMMDDDYINALEYGMPPAGGLGIGIDRMVMLLTDSSSIRDVLLFPTMKPKGEQSL